MPRAVVGLPFPCQDERHELDRVANLLIQAELPVILWLVIVGARVPDGNTLD
jgi:hypothetical protein